MVPVFFSSGASSIACVSYEMVNELYAMGTYIQTSSSRFFSSVLSTTVLAEPDGPTSITGFLRLSIMFER